MFKTIRQYPQQGSSGGQVFQEAMDILFFMRVVMFKLRSMFHKNCWHMVIRRTLDRLNMARKSVKIFQ